jgi:hypothetical protein
MKKATQKSSPNHRSSDQYSKAKSSRKAGPKKQKTGKCCIDEFDEQLVLRTLQSGATLDQHNIVVCPAEHEHEIDIAPFIEKLREAGHNIVQYAEIWKGDCPILGKGRARNMTRVYSYIDTNRSAAND